MIENKAAQSARRFGAQAPKSISTPAVADARWTQAIKRGTSVRQKLIEAEGGSFSVDEAARELGVSKSALLMRFANGKLIAWCGEGQNAVRLPVWQFSNGQVVPGLEDVLAVLDDGNWLDDFGRIFFFLSNVGFHGGERPLDRLRRGEIHKVVQAAQGYAQD
jgi:hypothetical protein